MILKRKHFGILLIIATMLIFGIRIINLDADVPAYELGYYMQFDEGFYAVDGIKIARPEMVAVQQAVDDTGLRQWPTSDSWIVTVMVALSLRLFGNNYYGLRMSSVIQGFLILVMLLLIMLRERRENHYFEVVFPSLILLSSYGFLLATRIVEPSIGRCFFLMLFLLIGYFQERGNKPGLFTYGVVAMVCVVLSYPTNIFIIGAAGCQILYKLILGRKTLADFIKKLLIFVGGMTAGYAICEPLYYMAEGTTFASRFVLDVSKQAGSLIVLSPSAFKNNICDYLKSNTVIYTPAIVVLITVGIVWCAYKGIKEKQGFYALVFFTVVMHAAQSVLVSDFVARKSVVIFPAFLLCLFLLIRDYDEALLKIKNCRYSRLFTFFWLIETAVMMYFSYRKIWVISDCLTTPVLKMILVAFMELQLALLAVLILTVKKDGKKAVVVAFMIITIIPAVIMSIKTVFCSEKTEKAAMIDIGSIVGDKCVLGGFPYCACLYNDIIPMSGMYDYYLDEEYDTRNRFLMAKDEVQYFVGFKEDERLATWSEGTEYEWELVKEYKTSFYLPDRSDETNNYYLYRKVRKDEK